jgi:ATP-dependent helicase/nuclease subunit A
MNLPNYLARLDDAQREASAAERSCVVTAGAGAGKTTVLASRYLHLVMGKRIPVSSILALTFTKKASAEMYERIYKALAAQAGSTESSPGKPPASTEDQAWASEQLGDFQNAHITTLDSFCAEIVRQAARDYGYSPEFAVDAETSDDLAKSIAYRYVLRHRDADGLDALLRSFTFDDVAARLFGDVGARLVTPQALAEETFRPMKVSMAALAEKKEAEALERLAAMSREVLSLAAGAPSPKADCAAAIEASASFLEAREAGADSRAALKAIQTLKLRSYSKAESEQAIKAIIQGAKDAGIQGARDLAFDLEDFAEYRAAEPSHHALYDRLDEYARELAEAKRRADVMDFKDLGACAVHTLVRRKDLRSRWKAQIRAIMIDEFQDNNELQKDLLYLLAERGEESADGIPAPKTLAEGKLFFVGDEKQSIYRFRGADVSVFKRLSAELSDAKGSGPGSDEIILSSNYRSAARLIGFFNAFFAAVMPGEGEGVREFAARYAAMTPGPAEARREARPFPSQIAYYLDETAADAADDEDEGAESGDEPGAVPENIAEELDDAGAPGSTPLDADDNIAFEVARFIRRECGALDLRAGERDGIPATRKAVYGDCAVLLRTTTHQHRLEKYFRLLDIPFESESPRSLFRESPANDLYSLLTLAQDPGDKAAYAAVLRGPLCRVSDEAFLRLMTSGGTAFELPGASAEDAAALARAAAFFAALDRALATSSIAEALEFAWQRGGMRLDLLARPEAHAFLEHFDYLFHLAATVECEQGGLAEFLARMRPYIEGEEDKFELDNVPRDSARGVKVMTIHKAKGLQFPIVIIPWVENAGSVRRSQTLWERFPEGLAIDVKPWDKPGAKASNILYRLARDLEEEKEIAEIKRLLYVACTRAEDHLFFFGRRKKTADSKGRSFQRYLEACGEAAGEPLLERVPLARNTLDEVRSWYRAREKPPIHAFAEAYEKAGAIDRSAPRRRIAATKIADIDQDASGGSQASKSAGGGAVGSAEGAAPQALAADVFGTLCPDAVEPAIAAAAAGAPAAAAADAFVPRAELLRGVPEPAAASAAAQAIAMAAGFMRSSFWTSLPQDARRRTETAFLLALGGYIVDGRIDLLVEMQDEVVIIDFKSDADQRAERHRAQLSLYRRAAAGLAPGKRVKVGLYWLRTGELEWQAEDLSEEVLLDLARRAAEALDNPSA